MRILASSEQDGTEKMKIIKIELSDLANLYTVLFSFQQMIASQEFFFPPKIWFGNVPLLSKEIICMVFVLRNKRMFPTEMSKEMEVDGPRGAFT